MRVLVLGATGFIGQHLVRALDIAGHDTCCAGRNPGKLRQLFPAHSHVLLDLEATAQAPNWPVILQGVDAVVNAAGVLQGCGMAAVQAAGPIAMFQAARMCGIDRLVQISALGAADDAPTPFLRTKAVADNAELANRPPGWTEVRPSLVYGPGGGSAELFAALAALPIQVRIGGGMVRPIQVGDLAAGIVRLLETERPLSPILEAVGPEETTIDGFVEEFRRWLGLPPVPGIPIPAGLLALLGRVGGLFSPGLVSPDTLRMLERGATADPEPFVTATGLKPASVREGLARTPATRADRMASFLYFLRAPLRWSLAFLWVISGLVSLGFYPLGDSLALLAAVGIEGPWAVPLLYAASAWDMALGISLAVGWRVRLVGGLQLATMVAYTILLTAFLPALWLHPFGPVFKNIPLAVATLAMMALEE
jgi:uncharacterized protein YbjT (DUF2867 family)